MVVRSLFTLLGFNADSAGMRKYDQIMQSVVRTTVILATATVAMAVAFLKGAGDIEQTRIAFETMLGSAKKADALIKEITEFAAKTPFELTGLIESSKKLLAFGFAGDEIIEKMTNLGNIAAGVGRQKLPSIILAFGKIRTKGKATMEELNIMLEAGVPILEELAKGMNVTKREIVKLVSKGVVGFDDVDRALTNMATGSGRFANLMEKQSKSFLGIVSNIGDFITNLSNDIGADLLPAAKSISKAFLEFLETNREIIRGNIVKFFFNLAKAVAFVFIFIKKLFERLKPFIKKLSEAFGGVDDLSKVFRELLKATAPVFKAVFNFIGLLGDLFAEVAKVFKEMGVGDAIMDSLAATFKRIGAQIQFVVDVLKFIKPVIDLIIAPLVFLFKLWVELWGFIENTTADVVNSIIPVIQTFIDDWVKIFINLGTQIVKEFNMIVKFFADVWDSIVNIFKAAIETITKFIDNLFGSIGDVLQAIGDIAGFVGGGIASTVGGVVETVGGAANALFGQPANDVMIPNAVGAGGGSMNLNVSSNINVGVPAGTPQEQQQQLETNAKIAVQEEWQSILREVTINAPPFEVRGR